MRYLCIKRFFILFQYYGQMATPLEELDRILESINATEAQRCFLRTYVRNENITNIAHVGRRTPEELVGVFRHGMEGHAISATTGDGREVRITIGDQTNSVIRDQVCVQVRQANGTWEIYYTALDTNRLNGPQRSSVLWQDAEIGNVGQPGVRSYRHRSTTIDGAGQPHRDAPNARHRQMDGYHGCAVPIARNDGHSLRLEPTV